MGLTALVTLLYLFFNKNKNNKYIYKRDRDSLKEFWKNYSNFFKTSSSKYLVAVSLKGGYSTNFYLQPAVIIWGGFI